MMKEPTDAKSRRGKPWTPDAFEAVMERVYVEFRRGAAQISPFSSAHEAIAKIREEYLELEREIFEKKRDEENWPLRLEEACHIAAVAFKFMIEFREGEH